MIRHRVSLLDKYEKQSLTYDPYIFCSTFIVIFNCTISAAMFKERVNVSGKANSPDADRVLHEGTQTGHEHRCGQEPRLQRLVCARTQDIRYQKGRRHTPRQRHQHLLFKREKY